MSPGRIQFLCAVLLLAALAGGTTWGAEQPESLKRQERQAQDSIMEGNYVEAERKYRSLCAAKTRLLGAEHRDTLRSRAALAWVLSTEGKHAEAQKEFRALLTIEERISGAGEAIAFHACMNL